jgi:hypothetical protein
MAAKTIVQEHFLQVVTTSNNTPMTPCFHQLLCYNFASVVCALNSFVWTVSSSMKIEISGELHLATALFYDHITNAFIKD